MLGNFLQEFAVENGTFVTRWPCDQPMNKKNKILKVAKAIAVIITVIVVCVFLASFLRPIPLGLYGGRPDATDFRIMQKDFNPGPYIDAANDYIREWHYSRGRALMYWETPKIVVERETSVNVFFADKEPYRLRNGSVVLRKKLPDMQGVEVAKEDMASEFIPSYWRSLC